MEFEEETRELYLNLKQLIIPLASNLNDAIEDPEDSSSFSDEDAEVREELLEHVNRTRNELEYDISVAVDAVDSVKHDDDEHGSFIEATDKVIEVVDNLLWVLQESAETFNDPKSVAAVQTWDYAKLKGLYRKRQRQ